MRQRYLREESCSNPDERGPDCMQEQKLSTERNRRIAQMKWLQDFVIEEACCLKLRWESTLMPRSFRVVEEEGRVVPAMFIEDGGERFLRCVDVPINMTSDFCGLS